MKLRPSPSEKQLALDLKEHGGARRGAGQKKSLKSQVNHVKRPKIDGQCPLGITWKLIGGLASIRGPAFMALLARAFRLCRRFGLRVTHYSVQSNHLHLIVEADSNAALERGMRSLGTSVAKAVQRTVGFGFRGKVLLGRYHLHVLKTPTEVKRAIRYVVFNFAKHMKCAPMVDAYSSAYDTPDLSRLVGEEDVLRVLSGLSRRPKWQSDLAKVLARPQTWLLAKGWLKVA